MGLIILVLILALLNALAFWQRHIFLYILAGGPDIVFGLYYAFQTDPLTHTAVQYTPTWYAGIVIVIVGVFCVWRAASKLWNEHLR